MAIDTETIQQIGQEIGLQFNPHKVILFGSYAHGNPRPDSDIDLLVVIPLDARPLRQAARILKSIYERFHIASIDLILKSPEEIPLRYEGRDPIVRDALDRGKVLYERM